MSHPCAHCVCFALEKYTWNYQKKKLKKRGEKKKEEISTTPLHRLDRLLKVILKQEKRIKKGKDLIWKRGIINTHTKQHRIFEVGA